MSAARPAGHHVHFRSFDRSSANSTAVENASLLSFAPSIVAVIIVKLAPDDVVAQILNFFPVRVKSLHTPRETSTAGQV